jgi:acetate---CoA ligase (ADP-forming)
MIKSAREGNPARAGAAAATSRAPARSVLTSIIPQAAPREYANRVVRARPSGLRTQGRFRPPRPHRGRPAEALHALPQPAMPNTTPPTWSKDVILANGTPLRLRPIAPADDARIIRFFYRLSPQTVYRRFMSMITRMDETEVKRFTHIDFDHEMAIVGVLEDEAEPGGERIIAVGRYVRLPKPTHAEVAFTVEDAYQGQGIGTHLLQELIPFARMADIEVLEAEVLAENHQMLGVFKNMGFTLSSSLHEGVVHIEFAMKETELTQGRRFAREQSAYVASMERLFRPRAVAVIGASNAPGTIGSAIVRNLISAEYAGPVYPVNPKHSVVHSVPCYPSLHDVPREIDLAIVAVPAAAVPQVVRECALKHVYALVIISAGFAEIGPKGRALQNEVQEIARRHGMRIVGPNCLGMLNTEAGVRLNATFAPMFPPPGNVALSSQSGALGIAMLNLARELRLGISQFIGVGNKADISGNDLLYFWGNDPNTRVILLYLESFGNPKKFSRIARRVSMNKPIVVLKSGTSQAGARAASSHTGALAASNVVVETLLEQAGIIRTETMEQFFHAAKLLSTQPLPAGPRLGILTNAGGPGIISADRAEVEGLKVPRLSDALQARLRPHVPESASTLNPVDMIASASAGQYEACLKVLLESDEVDLVLVMFIPPLVTAAPDVARAILAARHATDGAKPLAACLMGEAERAAYLDELEAASIPTFRFPEDAVVSLAQLTRYRDWRYRERGTFVRFKEARVEEARTLIRAHAGDDPEREPVWLPPLEGYRLLECYGIPTLPTRFAKSASDAVQVAESMGYPLAMKLASTTILHKSDVHGICLNLRSGREVRGAFLELEETLQGIGRREEMDGVLLQPMSKSGLEAVLGMSYDPNFGPVLMVGLGGVYLELFRDVQFALHPVTDLDVERMLGRLKSHRIFVGYRGEPARDLGALSETLLRLSQLVEDHPHIREIDLNPVMLMERGQGCVVVDARVRVAGVDPFTEYVISHLSD